MKVTLPSSRRGRVWLGVGVFVGMVSVVGAISDANKDPRDHQYEMCIKAYHDPQHCYEDVYGRNAPSGPSVDTPTTGPSSTNEPDPQGPTSVPDWGDALNTHGHFHFNPTAPLDTSEVRDLR